MVSLVLAFVSFTRTPTAHFVAVFVDVGIQKKTRVERAVSEFIRVPVERMTGYIYAYYAFFQRKFCLVVVFFQVGIIDGESRVFFYHVAEKAHLIAFALFGYKRDALDQNFTHSDHLRSASAERVERARVYEVFDKTFVKHFAFATRYEVFKRRVITVQFSFGDDRIAESPMPFIAARP